MRTIGLYRDRVAFAAALVLPPAVAAGLVPFRTNFANPAAALVLVVVVVAVAANGDRISGVTASIFSSLWFDFFLTRPYERFSISSRPDIETAVTLLCVGLAVSELAVRNRRHERRAREGDDYVELLHSLGELLATGAPPEEVIGLARSALIELLRLRACRYEAGAMDPAVTTIGHDGEVMLGRLRWGVQRMGLPGAQLQLPVESVGRTVGYFLLAPTPGVPVSLQRRLVAVSVADQVGAALDPERASA